MDPKKRTLLACVVASAAVSFIATSLLLFVGLAPSAGGATIVSYDDLKKDVASGSVRRIVISDQTYRYYGASGPPKQATGPTLDLASIRMLCAAPPNGLGPDVELEP
ncbi:MAG: hypothetical protein ABI183_19670 [Polyangiaceae bacterium]